MRFIPSLIIASLFLFFFGADHARADDAQAKQADEKKSGDEKPKKKPSPKIEVIKEVTHVLGPLRDDGYVNYPEALNQLLSKGVTPENNAAVAINMALGPNGGDMKSMPDEYKERFWKRLGVKMPPEKGDYIVGLAEVAEALEIEVQQTIDEQGESYKPWSKEDLPSMAHWVKVNEKALVVVSDGVKRKHWYMPLVDSDDEDTMVVALLLPVVQSCRSIARLLMARSMNRLHEGNVEGAFEDMMTIRRLARHVAKGSTLVERLVGTALDGMACGGDRLIAQSGRSMTGQLLNFQKQIEALPPIPRMADAINTGERFLLLDACVHLARQTPHALELLDMEADGAAGGLTKLLSNALIDWNEPMKMGNKWYDRLVVAARKPTYLEQKKAMAQIDADIKKLAERAKDPKAFAIKFFFTGSPRKAVGRQIGSILVALLLPAVSAATDAEHRVDFSVDMSRLTFAISAYKNDHDKFPEKLDMLAPKYIKTIPKDIYIDKPLKYERTDDGYLFYSVGRNQVDDGGNGWWEENSEGDDLAVRFPRREVE